VDTKYRPGRFAKQFATKTATVEIELKAKGGFVARFFTFGGPDSDGDIQVPGSIVNEGATVPVSSWGHGSWTNNPPVGQATLATDGKGALAQGSFYLNTQAGREHFEIITAAGKTQEWSYGYDIVDHDLDADGHRVLRRQVVHEISPVLRAAGLETATISIETSSADMSDLPAIAANVKARTADSLGRGELARSLALITRYQRTR
jgi:hypothetical protein